MRQAPAHTMQRYYERLGRFSRPARFLLSGATAAVVYWLVAWWARRSGQSLFAAGFLGYLAALPAAYLLHRTFTFRSHASVPAESSRFVLGSILGIGLSSLFPAAMVRFELPFTIALTITCILVPLINYFVLSRWAFAAGNDHG
jgi:putative flippase GtrA